MSPEARERASRKAEKLIEEMPLNELRAARKMTQEKLAENLSMKQAAVSKLERRADTYDRLALHKHSGEMNKSDKLCSLF